MPEITLEEIIRQRSQSDTTDLPVEEQKIGGKTVQIIKGKPEETEGKEYKVDQAKMAGYAIKMEEAEESMARLKKDRIDERGRIVPGFDPVNTYDSLVQFLAPDSVENAFLTHDKIMYEMAKKLWSNANVRAVTGATIKDEEADLEDITYFPSYWGGQASVDDGVKNRAAVLNTTRQMAGDAYLDAKFAKLNRSRNVNDPEEEGGGRYTGNADILVRKFYDPETSPSEKEMIRQYFNDMNVMEKVIKDKDKILERALTKLPPIQ